MTSAAVAASAHRGAHVRRGFALEWITPGWNMVGIAVLAIAAVAARSVALAGLGLDSVIEVGASTVVLWQLSSAGVARRYAHNRSPAGPRRVSSKAFPCCTIAQINSFHESTPSHPDPLTEASPGDSVRWPHGTLPEAPANTPKLHPNS